MPRRHQRCRQRLLAFRVAETIDKATQVAHVVIDERLDLELDIEVVAQQLETGHGAIKQEAAVTALQPHQKVALGRRHTPFHGKRRHLETTIQLRPEPTAERNHLQHIAILSTVDQLAQRGTHRVLAITLAQAQLDKDMLVMGLVEYRRLVAGHGQALLRKRRLPYQPRARSAALPPFVYILKWPHPVPDPSL